jgi:hypothetical protein
MNGIGLVAPAPALAGAGEFLVNPNNSPRRKNAPGLPNPHAYFLSFLTAGPVFSKKIKKTANPKTPTLIALSATLNSGQ